MNRRESPCLGFWEKIRKSLLGGEQRCEIASALARREGEKLLDAAEVEAALATARQLADSWHEIVPSTSVRRTAERLLRVHPLRAADSLQLAAALVAADHDPTTLDVICLDARLATAARREGFKVIEA